MHTRYMRPAGSSRLAFGPPPPVALACVTMVIVATRPDVQLVAIMIWVCPASVLSWGRRFVGGRPRQQVRSDWLFKVGH